MHNVRLLDIDSDLLESLESSQTFFEKYSADISQTFDFAKQVAIQSLEFQKRVSAIPPWTGYFGVDSEKNLVFGCAGFKGNPDDQHQVEIAYATFAPFENLGYATSIAKSMVDISRESEQVKKVCAHTLPERNASCRVLEKNGFTFKGEVEDPEDGIVWRWLFDI